MFTMAFFFKFEITLWYSAVDIFSGILTNDLIVVGGSDYLVKEYIVLCVDVVQRTWI